MGEEMALDLKVALGFHYWLAAGQIQRNYAANILTSRLSRVAAGENQTKQPPCLIPRRFHRKVAVPANGVPPALALKHIMNAPGFALPPRAESRHLRIPDNASGGDFIDNGFSDGCTHMGLSV
jgi:hypothetical protein